MLILKSPLVLQSISAFGTFSDAFGEKIRGNYQIFGAEISGEDLLHMTMQEPDIYVGIENTGPFLMDTHIHADNQVKLELVNQLVNRLMLCDSREFTYQDEVFTAAVLQKLGITDVKEFMRQIRLHMEKNELTVSLLNRYFEDGRAAALTIDEFFESNIFEKQELEIIKNENYLGCNFHNQVFRRLMTAECNNAVYTYQNPVQTKGSVTKRFHDMEWMVQADRIHLSQFREAMYYQENPVSIQEFSGYEAKPLAADELIRRKVTARMGAAILENIVNKINYGLQYTYGGTKTWKNYSSLFYGSAESVLARFRYFQNNNTFSITQTGQYEKHMNGLVRDELRLVQLMSLADKYAGAVEEDVAPYEDLRRNIVLSVFENQNLQKQLTEQFLNKSRMIQWKQEYSVQETQEVRQQRYYLEEQEFYREGQKRFEEAYRLLRQKRNDTYLFETDGTYHSVTAEDFWEEKQAQDMEIPVAGGKSILHESVMPAAAIENVIDIGLHDIETAAGQRQAMIKNENGIYEIIRSFADSETDSDVPLMENIGLLEQINRHNVYMKQLLDSRTEEKETLKRIVVDRQQARAAALRALANPEQALMEIYENGRAIEAGMPNEIERILSITDENTRHFYENLMGIDSADSDGHIGLEQDKNHGRASDTTDGEPKAVIENALRSLREIHETSRINREELSEIIRQMRSISSETVVSTQEKHLENDTQDAAGLKPMENEPYKDNTSVVWKHSVPKEIVENVLGIFRQIYESGTTVYDKLPPDTLKEIELIFNMDNSSTQNYYEQLMPGVSGMDNIVSGRDMDTDSNDMVLPRQPGGETEALMHRFVQDMILETGESTRRREHERTQEAFGQEFPHETEIIENSRETLTKQMEERERFRQFKDKVYLLLNHIETNEREYRNDIHRVSRQVQETAGMEENVTRAQLLRHKSADITIEDMMTLQHLRTSSRDKIITEQAVEHGLQLVHKTKEQMNQELVDEVVMTLKERGVFKTNVSETKEETLFTQKELLDVRNEIIRQSEEHIANLVERNMKTQMHTISDMVYLELERRLKNEQRRRGY